MSLAQLLESKFRGDVRFRGQAYLQAERVSVTRVTADHLHAVVRDGEEYQTQISRDGGKLRMFCTCTTTGKEYACKHLWATILSVDAGSYLTGLPRLDDCPPFVADQAILTTSPIFGIDDSEDGGGDVFHPSVDTVRVRQREVLRQIPEWQRRLEAIHQELVPKATSSVSQQRERQIFYEIDVDESKTAGQVVIQTSQRQLRANGLWGSLKPLKLRPGKLDDVELEIDRKILAYLSGGTPERTNWHAQQAEFQSATFRYRLPPELCELLFPMMCATERVRYVGTEERKQSSLKWDDSQPWSLTVKVSEDKKAKEWQLVPELRRGDETRTLDDIRLIVPGLVLTEDSISRLDDFGAFSWVKLLNGNEGLHVPLKDGKDLISLIWNMPVLPQLDLPEKLRLDEVEAKATPCLRLRVPRMRGWKHERLSGVVEFEYLESRVRGSQSQWALVQPELGRCIVRDRSTESACWTRLNELGFRRRLGEHAGDADVDIAANELGRAIRPLMGEGWRIEADGKRVQEAGGIEFKIKSGIDWFELSANIDFHGHTVPFPELLSALSRGETTIRLDDGSFGLLPEEWLEQFGYLAGLGTVVDENLRFSNAQASLLDALLSSQPMVDVDAQFADLREQFKSFEGIAPHDEPQDFHGALRVYQKEGLGWLRFLENFRLGGCLADDMGLGKTVQLLALFAVRKTEREKHLPSLVVVPKSLMFNWQNELQRFTPQLSVMEYAGLEREELREQIAKYDVVLTTYGTLRRDILHLKDIHFDYAVLDEAQQIKNSSSQVAKASRLLHADHRLALSGTPIENHLGDLWSIFEFLNPSMLGRSSAFRVFASGERDDDARAVLAKALRPFILRRTKSQVAAELPDRVEETIVCRMGRRQRQLYDELREHYRQSLLGMVKDQGLGKSKMHVLEALLRLRQAACHPALLDRGEEEDAYAKLDVLCPHLEELIEEGHKSLVFSQFTSLLAIVKKHLDKRGIRYAYLDGKTRGRRQVIEEFQDDPDVKVFLISLKAGGLGLNLTAAEYVFLLDPWWNPAVEAQAIDRAHRIGQTRTVFAYRLICQDTVEEKILELQKNKRELADAILEENNNVIRDLTSEDLELLLS